MKAQDEVFPATRTEPLPGFLHEIFRTQQVFDREGNPHPLGSNVSQEEALSLHAAIRRIRPQRSLEVGLAHGVSALSILAAISANGFGHHHAIDPFQRTYHGCGEAMIDRAGLKSLHTFYERFPEAVIPDLPRLQFAFIDSSHLFDLTLVEFVLVDKILDVGGVIALHDLWMPSIQTVVRYILSNRSYEVCYDLSPRPNPLTILQRAKLLIGFGLRRLDGIDKLLSPEISRPWCTLRMPNLVFLKKLSADKRDWRFHQRF